LHETLFVDETKSANLGALAGIPPLNGLILDFLNELNQTATFLAFISPAYLLHYDTMGIIRAQKVSVKTTGLSNYCTGD